MKICAAHLLHSALLEAALFSSCSAILPDASTASYRLTHDVSFDEGSRYRGAAAIPFVSFKNGDDAREGRFVVIYRLI